MAPQSQTKQILDAVLVLTKESGTHSAKLSEIATHLATLNGSVARHEQAIQTIQSTCSERSAVKQTERTANERWMKYLKWPAWGVGAVVAGHVLNHLPDFVQAAKLLKP